jgi:hypothetical protein
MSQLNFFLTDNELRDILRFAQQTGDYKIFIGRFFKNLKPIQINNVDELIDFDSLTIWVNNNFVEPICSQKGRGNFADYVLFDYYNDPIIELDNCKFSNGLISPGRLFYKIGWIKNNELSLIHKKMASKLVRIFNKDLINISSPFKISAGIDKLIRDGYEIELGEGGLRLNIENINAS